MTTAAAKMHYTISLFNDPDVRVDFYSRTIYRTVYTWDARGSNLVTPLYDRVILDFEAMAWRVELGADDNYNVLFDEEARAWVASHVDIAAVVGALRERNQRDVMIHAIRRFMRDAGLSVDDLMRGLLDDMSGDDFDAFTDKIQKSVPTTVVVPEAWPANRYEWLMLLVDLRRWI